MSAVRICYLLPNNNGNTMDIIHLQTKDELLEILEWIFFRKEGEYHEICEARLSFEETCSILGISDRDFAPGVEVDSDEYYDVIENLGDSDLRRVVLSDECPIVRDFTPGTLVWKLSDEWDRLGDFNIRLFVFSPDGETTADFHRDWRKGKQAEYDRSVEIESQILLAESQIRQ